MPVKAAEQQRRAAGYVRVSQVGDRHGESFMSPDVQREKIEAWAAYRGFRIVRWYIDLDVSGRGNATRPEFERMMADARDRRFEAIAVYRLTRFARSVQRAAEAYAELRELGVALVSVTEDIDTTTASGGLMQNILFALAEFESERIGEEWRVVHQQRRRRGIANVTVPMLGYQVADGSITAVEEAEAVAVRIIFTMRGQGASLPAIADELQRRGFRTKQNKPRFSSSALRVILKSPLYAGLLEVDGELRDAQHPPIITREQWQLVQATQDRANEMARFTSTSALLTGLVTCSGCEHRLRTGHGGPAGNLVYRCTHRQESWTCDRPVTILVGPVDDHVERAFLRRFDPRRMPNRGRVRRTRQQQAWTRQATRLRARVAELTRALDELADQRYVKGTLDGAEYERQTARFLHEREQARDEADELDRLAASQAPRELDALGLWPQLPLAAKRRALGMLIDHVMIAPADPHAPRGKDRRASVTKRVSVAWRA